MRLNREELNMKSFAEFEKAHIYRVEKQSNRLIDLIEFEQSSRK